MDISKPTVTITSYNAHNLNSADYYARFPPGMPLMADTDPQFTERLDEYPLEARTRLKERTLPITINIKGSGTVDQLKQWFNEGKTTRKKLIVTDSTDSSTWYVYARLQSFVKRRNSTSVIDVVLSVGDSIWRKNTTTTVAWSVTASGQTQNIDVTGTEFARPIITLTPKTANSTTYAYKRFAVVYNTTDRAFINYPLNITGGNLNHAALVGGGKAQADGDDCRCFVDDAEVDLWTGGGGFNSATFRPWINLNLKPKIEVTTLGAIAGTGAVSSITIAITQNNLEALGKLKLADKKIVLIDSELFSFSNCTITTDSLEITGMSRAKFGTSMAAHGAGSTVRWIEHVIWVMYGMSSATAPTLSSRRQPMIDRTNSTNTSWVYTDYFDPDNPGRSGTWRGEVLETKNLSTTSPSSTYGGNHMTVSDMSTISAEMGMYLRNWNNGIWRNEAGKIEWRLYHPAGVTTVTASGEAYRVTASWPAQVGLQASTNGQVWNTIWNDTSPAGAGAWTALAAHSAVALGATYNLIRFVMDGSIAASSADNYAAVEYDSITLALASGNIPSVTLNAEQANYYVNVKIRNDTTDQYIIVRIPSAIDVNTIIDCDAKTVKDETGVNMRAALTYGADEVRRDWLTLDPTVGSPTGRNVISVTEAGLARIDLSVAYEARSL